MRCFYHRESPVWIGWTKESNNDTWLSLDGKSENSTIIDFRPPFQNIREEMDTALKNSEACVKLTPSGIVDISYNESCSESFPALCSYRQIFFRHILFTELTYIFCHLESGLGSLFLSLLGSNNLKLVNEPFHYHREIGPKTQRPKNTLMLDVGWN